MRVDQRAPSELRPLKLEIGSNIYAEGSALISCGDTKVYCTASVEERVPAFLKGTGSGWVTAEYDMLPRATQTRNQRERQRNGISGRTQEIQRLIGRSLRAVCNLEALGERSIYLDCDVLQADGGTRTAAITASWVALICALNGLVRERRLRQLPILSQAAAVSVGLVNNQVLLDLCYVEDSSAQVDMNVVMNSHAELIEVQGCGERSTFSRQQMNAMIDLAEKGLGELFVLQREALASHSIYLPKQITHE
ncbi:MAG: ribonuclease PH [Symbiobacteriaceae bacterium]|nr:ribonuclease PH [Symbiobacteriaceae bacterium]